MYNKKNIKNLFNSVGIRVEFEMEIQENCFVAKVSKKNNIYIWNNEIVSKKDFYNNYLKKVLTNNQ